MNWKSYRTGKLISENECLCESVAPTSRFVASASLNTSLHFLPANCWNRNSKAAVAIARERLQGMVAAVCAEEFVTRPSYMGCRECDYGDLCEMGEKVE